MKNEITPKELHALLQNPGSSTVLVDVREDNEIAMCSLPNPIHIPLAEIPSRFSEIPKDKEVIVYCRVGGRSGQAVQFLLNNGYANVKNLVGGINQWADDVDPTIEKY